MVFREAKIEDIKQIQFVRNAVKENVLSNPHLVTDELCKTYLFKKGKGWVCEIENKIIGFSIVDLNGNSVWALFLKPEFENRGIGKQLHSLMLNWYFSQTETTILLGTDPNTRAEIFYKKAGWKPIGCYENGEIKFEMTFKNWTSRNK